jgi:hypothetical protein
MTQDEIAFERAKVCYEQNFQQMRSLNDQMNRIPTIAVTLTGGLWYGASLTNGVDHTIRFGLIVLAGFCDLALILACVRTRDVIESYLEKIKSFDVANYASGRPSKPVLGQMSNYSMIRVYCYLMAIVAVLSFLGAICYYWPFSASRAWGLAGILVLLETTYRLFFTNKSNKFPS